MTHDEPRPSFTVLADWIDGRLDGVEAATVARAVERGDVWTTASVAWLREFVDAAAALPMHEPPPFVRQRLHQYFARWHEARAVQQLSPVELMGSLRFDSRVDVALVGVRAADVHGEIFHLSYVTDAADLVLDVRRTAPGRVRLDGQVLTERPGTAPIFEATAVGPAGEVRTLEGDELGRFCLPDIADTTRQLRVTNGELAITVKLDLEDGPACR